MSPPIVSSRRRILLGMVGLCGLLIGASALMPSISDREVEQQRRKIDRLVRVPPPKLATRSAISLPWYTTQQNLPPRDVRIHLYLRVRPESLRMDTLNGSFGASEGAHGATVLHLVFDPKNTRELRIATAIAATSGKRTSRGGALRNAALLFGSPLASGTLGVAIAKVEREAGPSVLASSRSDVLAELADGSATAYPPGTVLLEAGGRFYRDPTSKPSKGTLPIPWTARASMPGTFEIVEALRDARVRLP